MPAGLCWLLPTGFVQAPLGLKPEKSPENFDNCNQNKVGLVYGAILIRYLDFQGYVGIPPSGALPHLLHIVINPYHPKWIPLVPGNLDVLGAQRCTCSQMRHGPDRQTALLLNRAKLLCHALELFFELEPPTKHIHSLQYNLKHGPRRETLLQAALGLSSGVGSTASHAVQ